MYLKGSLSITAKSILQHKFPLVDSTNVYIMSTTFHVIIGLWINIDICRALQFLKPVEKAT